MGECCVCGKETVQRCGSCGAAGFDLFFCSTVHQRLVWPAHKQVCGTRAKPFFPPDLSLEEAALLRKYADVPFGAESRVEQRKKGYFTIGCKYSAAQYFADALAFESELDFKAISKDALTRFAELFALELHPHANLFVRGLLIEAMRAGKASRDEWLTLHPTFYPTLIYVLLTPCVPDLRADILTSVYHQSLAFITVAKARAAQPHEPPSTDPLSRDNVRALFHRVFDTVLPFCYFSSAEQAQLILQTLLDPLTFFGNHIETDFVLDDVTGYLVRFDIEVSKP